MLDHYPRRSQKPGRRALPGDRHTARLGVQRNLGRHVGPGRIAAPGGIGGLIGGLAAYAAFNSYQTSMMNFQTFSQVAFAFQVTPELLAGGIALRAARQPIPTALRAL